MKKTLIAILFFFLNVGLYASSGKSDQYDCAPAEVSLVKAEVSIFGEYHGTNEIPELFYNILCNISHNEGGSVLVALELSRDLTSLFNVSYANRDEFITTVLESEHWGEYGDGRHSPAMVHLLGRLYELRESSDGNLILIGLVEDDWDEKAPVRVQEIVKEQNVEKVVALVGNWHSRKYPSEGFNGYPYGHYMTELFPDVLTYDIWAKSGEFWACLDECGPMDVFPRQVSVTTDGVYELICHEEDMCPYDGFMLINELTISR